MTGPTSLVGDARLRGRGGRGGPEPAASTGDHAYHLDLEARLGTLTRRVEELTKALGSLAEALQTSEPTERDLLVLYARHHLRELDDAGP